MKGPAIQRLAKKYVLPLCPHLGLEKRLLYVKPIGAVLRGFYFDSSSFDADIFFLQMFVQPLYVKSEGICFPIGDRLWRPSVTFRDWRVTENTEAEVMNDLVRVIYDRGDPFLNARSSPLLLAESLLADRDGITVESHELIGYSLALVPGRQDEAVAHLDLYTGFDIAPEHTTQWDIQSNARATRLRRAIERGGSVARELLEEWRRETLASAKLSHLAEPQMQLDTD